MADKANHSHLLEVWVVLGKRERSVLVRVAERLWAGQQQYGILTKKKKNWVKEAQEEAFDMAVYLSALLEDIKEK